MNVPTTTYVNSPPSANKIHIKQDKTETTEIWALDFIISIASMKTTCAIASPLSRSLHSCSSRFLWRREHLLPAANRLRTRNMGSIVEPKKKFATAKRVAGQKKDVWWAFNVIKQRRGGMLIAAGQSSTKLPLPLQFSQCENV